MCDRCWELERRIGAEPEIARRMLASRVVIPGALFELSLMCWVLMVALCIDTIEAILQGGEKCLRRAGLITLVSLLVCNLVAQSSRDASPAEQREQACAGDKQKCVDRVWPRVKQLRKECQQEIDNAVKTMKIQAVLVALTSVSSRGAAALGLVGAQGLHASTMEKLDTIKNTYETRIQSVLDECKVNERCPDQSAWRMPEVIAWSGIVAGLALLTRGLALEVRKWR